jgi:23S rRNA (adenine-N6)-dimethyltransferase
VGERRRPPRSGAARPDGQHFLRSREIAAELVQQAGIGPADHVFEIGAGAGRLTEALAARARLVTAVELDPDLATRLRRTFRGDRAIEVVHGDVLRTPTPVRPYRAFGNIPFAITTAMLRRLLDEPDGPLQRADLLMQFETARKRASSWPSTLLSLSWQPWWEFTLARRVPRHGFEPPPAVDAGLLVVTRRHALLPIEDRGAYVRMVRRSFNKSSWPVRRSLRAELPPMTWKHLARDRGLSVDATPRDLDVFDWVAVWKASTR